MPIFDVFSKRLKKASTTPTIYQFEEAPGELRVQIVHVLLSTLGDYDNYRNPYDSKCAKIAYDQVVAILRREYGVFSLSGRNDSGEESIKELFNFMLKAETTQFLDCCELALGAIAILCPEWDHSGEAVADAIDEANARFREHSFGYQFSGGRMLRVENLYSFQEIAKPAIEILSGKHFQGAQDEFISAHKHYKERKYKECINDCLKSFESTMKAICHNQRWSCPENATASALIKLCLDKELIPEYLQSQFTSIPSLLQSGLPTVRNRTSAHGQGTTRVEAPSYLASYCLSLTGTSILLLAEAERHL